WEHGEQMPSERVIPRRPEANQHFTLRLQKRVHDPQDLRRVLEMLEGVDGDDDLCLFTGRTRELTNIAQACRMRSRARCLQDVFTDVDTDHPFCSRARYFKRFFPFPASKVNCCFPHEPVEEFVSEQNAELGLVLIYAATAYIGFPGGDPFQKSILEIG